LENTTTKQLATTYKKEDKKIL